MKLKQLFIIVFVAISNNIFSQFSDLHYLPPLKSGKETNNIVNHRIYLTTPVATPFTVNVFQGTNPVAVASFLLSNAGPVILGANTSPLTLNNNSNNINLVTTANTGTDLTTAGLRFESSGEKFYVNYRGRRNNRHAASLTSKGRSAIGTSFRWGGVPMTNSNSSSSVSASLGIMATENGTTINLSDFDPSVVFTNFNPATDLPITLDANETFVLEVKRNAVSLPAGSTTGSNIDGWLGASITSDKGIVISNGNILGSVNPDNNNRLDATIDQSVPENKLGNEYVFIRGNGVNNTSSTEGLYDTESPIIIATQDDTTVSVGGTLITTLNAGEYISIDASRYSTATAGGNMYVSTSKNVYAYQLTAGATSYATIGLNFIAPVNCLLPSVLDNIADITNFAGDTLDVGVTIIASSATDNSDISITYGPGPTTTTMATPPPGTISSSVTGTPEWKTFFIPGLTGNISVTSTDQITIGFFGASGNQGAAGYFSGFDTVPPFNISISTTTRDCISGTTDSAVLLVNNTTFTSYQWFRNGIAVTAPILGPSGATFTPSVAGTYSVEIVILGCPFQSTANVDLSICASVVTNRRITYRVKN